MDAGAGHEGQRRRRVGSSPSSTWADRQRLERADRQEGRCWLRMPIGTWNLENLFRPGAAVGPTDQQAYQAKLTALAAKVTAMNPDVLAVQEVGDPDALADLSAAVGGPWHRRT